MSLYYSILHTQLASDQILFGFEVVTQWLHSDHFHIPNEEHYFHFYLVQGICKTCLTGTLSHYNKIEIDL